MQTFLRRHVVTNIRYLAKSMDSRDWHTTKKRARAYLTRIAFMDMLGYIVFICSHRSCIVSSATNFCEETFIKISRARVFPLRSTLCKIQLILWLRDGEESLVKNVLLGDRVCIASEVCIRQDGAAICLSLGCIDRRPIMQRGVFFDDFLKRWERSIRKAVRSPRRRWRRIRRWRSWALETRRILRMQVHLIGRRLDKQWIVTWHLHIRRQRQTS